MKFEEIEARARDARAQGRETVVVLGLGFVGTAVVANLSRAHKDGRPLFLVIGIDQDNAGGREKVEIPLHGGRLVVHDEDGAIISH